MSSLDDHLATNRAAWDERAAAHAASPDYDAGRYAADPAFLSPEVRFDRPRLGDVAGLRGVHLQCHIGTDTLSLARLGARMTGLDFSGASLEQARKLAASAAGGEGLTFVESDVYGAAQVLEPGSFDLVYTGIGALPWLPSVRRWAQVVAELLAPGGRLFMREGHPMLWTLGDRDDGLLLVEHPYFERPEPTIWEDDGTYVETGGLTFSHTTSADWNHGLGETVSALLDAGLQLTGLEEHDSAPWPPVQKDLLVRDEDDREFRLREGRERLPMTFTLQAVKPAR